jgi:hypothetical protein
MSEVLFERLRSGDYVIGLVGDEIVFKAGPTATVDEQLTTEISTNLDDLHEALLAARSEIARVADGYGTDGKRWKQLHRDLIRNWPPTPYEFIAWGKIVGWAAAHMTHARSIPAARETPARRTKAYRAACASFAERLIAWTEQRLVGAAVVWPSIRRRIARIKT